MVGVANETATPAFGSQVTIAAERPATFVGPATDLPAGWSCATAPLGASVTCTHDGEIPAGTQALPIRVDVAVVATVPTPCDPGTPAGEPCVFFRAWNGAANPAAEAAAVPAAIREPFGVRQEHGVPAREDDGFLAGERERGGAAGL